MSGFGYTKIWNKLYLYFKEIQMCRWHHPYGRKWRGTKEPLDEVKEESEKAGLNLSIQKNEDHGILSHHLMTNRWGNNGNSDSLYFLGLQNHCRLWLQGSWDGKASAYNAGDPGSVLGLGRSSGKGNGNPLQYSCLENPMDGGVW